MRGLIQLTGRANYSKYGKLLNLDLVSQPELALVPEVSVQIACLYWSQNGLNKFADAQDFVKITKRINGGLNGYEDRLKYYKLLLSYL